MGIWFSIYPEKGILGNIILICIIVHISKGIHCFITGVGPIIYAYIIRIYVFGFLFFGKPVFIYRSERSICLRGLSDGIIYIWNTFFFRYFWYIVWGVCIIVLLFGFIYFLKVLLIWVFSAVEWLVVVWF